ncbi:MAG TPA: VOC family protein [Actinomycetota bacterium]
MVVPARVSLVTLGVADVERATDFYRALGWQRSPASVAGEVSFFHTDGGLLALWDLAALAAETGQTPDTAPGGGFRHTMLALNLESPEEVNAVLDDVVAAGARVIKAAATTEWGGYSGCFADPDGHLWEVAYNPDFPVGPDGRPTLPRSADPA